MFIVYFMNHLICRCVFTKGGMFHHGAELVIIYMLFIHSLAETIMLNWKNSLAYRPAHTHNLDLKKGKNTNSLILMLPDAIIKSSTSENVNMIYLENGIMNNPRWLFLKCQHGVSLKCQHGCSNMISTQQCIYIYTCVSSFHCNGLWLSLHS